MKRSFSATLALFVCLHVTEASSQEVTPELDFQVYAEDMMRCGNENVWDICKQCVNDAWNGAQVPWAEFCEFLTKTGVSAERRAACYEEQSQSRRHKLSWCLTIELDQGMMRRAKPDLSHR
jgi:hypothetical protein